MNTDIKVIKHDCKTIKSSLQTLTNIALIAIASGLVKDAKEKGEDGIARAGKACLIASALVQILIIINDIIGLKEEMEIDD